MKTVVQLGDDYVSLEFSSFEETVDIDELTKIDYSNLFGEAVTISALMAKVGILKAKAEEVYDRKKFELAVYEANLRDTFRKSSDDGGKTIKLKDGSYVKLTEKTLEDAVTTDPGWKIKKKELNQSKYSLGVMDSVFWAVNSKDKKLNNLVKGVTPEELFDEIVEGTINGIVIKKKKGLYHEGRSNKND